MAPLILRQKRDDLPEAQIVLDSTVIYTYLALATCGQGESTPSLFLSVGLLLRFMGS